MSGSIHNKGVLILQGYMCSKYAQVLYFNKRISLSATNISKSFYCLTTEQAFDSKRIAVL